MVACHDLAVLGLGGELPPVPAKRYFTMTEAEALCGVPQRLLEAWSRRYLASGAGGARRSHRYWLRYEVLALRRIRTLLTRGLPPEAVTALHTLLETAEAQSEAQMGAYHTLEKAVTAAESRLTALSATLTPSSRPS